MSESGAAERRRSAKAGAAAVAGTSGLATFLVWLLGHFGVSLTAEDGAVIAGAVSSVTLFVWHTGLRNILGLLLDGTRSARASA